MEKDKYLDLARELKKTVKHEIDGDTNYNWYALKGPKSLGIKTGKTGNQKKNKDHLD